MKEINGGDFIREKLEVEPDVEFLRHWILYSEPICKVFDDVSFIKDVFR
jgi:hypothetical protein